MARKRRPVLGIDYIICDDGHAQFTREFLLKRGWCCEAECRFCPFPAEMRSESQRLSQLAFSEQEVAGAADGHR
jgi:hypothetical protein